VVKKEKDREGAERGNERYEQATERSILKKRVWIASTSPMGRKKRGAG
jgi:hypothetical protein